MNSNTLIEFSEDFTDDRLILLCDNVLDNVHDSLKDTSTLYDTAWTKGCLPYGRLQGLIIYLASNKVYDWLSLANNTMDFTAKIGKTPIQFLIDDSFSPKKKHRLHRNLVETMQLSMALEELTETKVVVWRCIVSIDKDGMNEPKATIVGYDSNQIEVCRWSYDETVRVPMSSPLAPVVEIEEVKLKRKLKVDKDTADDELSHE